LGLVEVGRYEKLLIDRVVIWAQIISVCLGLIAFVTIGAVWGLGVSFCASVLAYALGRWAIDRFWIKPELVKLNEKNGGLQ
jgi:hypothetical protein